MDITKGASIGKAFSLQEDTIFNGGNHRCPKITTNGFALVLNRIVPGAEIDGSKDPDDWGVNVEVNCAWPTEIGKDYIYRAYKWDESTDGFRDKLRRRHALEAAMHPIQWIHDNPTGTSAQWKADYIAEAVKAENDWWFSVEVLQTNLAALAGVSTWAEFVALVLEKTPDTWHGNETVLDVEVS